jgi:hypothetical protein
MSIIISIVCVPATLVVLITDALDDTDVRGSNWKVTATGVGYMERQSSQVSERYQRLQDNGLPSSPWWGCTKRRSQCRPTN